MQADKFSERIGIAIFCDYDKRIANDYWVQEEKGPYHELFEVLNMSGFECHTIDYFKKRKTLPQILLSFDIPRKNIPYQRNKEVKKVALLREPKQVIPGNYEVTAHANWDCLITWKKELVDNCKYFYATSVKEPLCSLPKSSKNKLCTLINSNITSTQEGELYSERRRAIDWFEKNHPNEFDFFGYNWDKYYFQSWKFLNHFHSLQRKKAPTWKCYKGIVADKLQVMSRYKFAICYENTCIEHGYVTEKIIDALLAGTVPIYWGAPDIEKYVPTSCFIDFREFRNYEKLYQYLKGMGDEEYNQYLNSIEAFIVSSEGQKFSPKAWIQYILKALLEIT